MNVEKNYMLKTFKIELCSDEIIAKKDTVIIKVNS